MNNCFSCSSSAHPSPNPCPFPLHPHLHKSAPPGSILTQTSVLGHKFWADFPATIFLSTCELSVVCRVSMCSLISLLFKRTWKRNADCLLCGEDKYRTVNKMRGGGDDLEPMPVFSFSVGCITSSCCSTFLTERHLRFLFGCGLI